MNNIERICLLGLGEVGLTLAEDLLKKGTVQLQCWDRQFGVDGSAAEQSWSKLQSVDAVVRAETASAAAHNCQLVLSAVTADEAINAAKSILPGLAEQAWFVDVNSVSPATKQSLDELVGQAGGRFVEAAIMSPIMLLRITSPILLSGPQAKAFEALGCELGFSGMQAVSATLGTAAASKMCRSVVIKGMEALVTESLLAARHYGVETAVLESLNNLFPRPDWPDYAYYLMTRSLQHGSRRAAEMREVAKTVGEAGLTPWMSLACAERQDWAAQFKTYLDEKTLEGLLDVINQHRTTKDVAL